MTTYNDDITVTAASQHYIMETPMFRKLFGKLVTPEPVDQLEYEFEDHIIVPLLVRWNVQYRRQVTCQIRKRGQIYMGRIDFLVHTEDNSTLLTLFENKRHIRSDIDRELAARQANEYARARRLRSFVIAAPEGLWVYSRPAGRPRLAASFGAHEVHAGAPAAKALLVDLRSVAR